MKILIVGAGAVGGYFGALLARAGRQVIFVARGEHGQAIANHGLLVISRSGEWRVQVPVVARVEDATAVDLAIVAVKTTALPDVARQLSPVLAPSGVAISLLNGLSSEEVLAASLGRQRVVGATALIGAERIAPGVIRHDARGFLVVGEAWPPGIGHAARVSDLFQSSGIPTQLTPDLAQVKWLKMAWNCGLNSLTALARTTVGGLASIPELQNTVRRAVEEVVNVGRASGVSLPDTATDQLMAQNADIGHVRTSMLQDIEAGRPTENEDLCGEIVRRGRELGVPTPLCEALYGLIRATSKA